MSSDRETTALPDEQTRTARNPSASKNLPFEQNAVRVQGEHFGTGFRTESKPETKGDMSMHSQIRKRLGKADPIEISVGNSRLNITRTTSASSAASDSKGEISSNVTPIRRPSSGNHHPDNTDMRSEQVE